MQENKSECFFLNTVYQVGQIKRGQCSFFRGSKERSREFDNFWQVKYQFIYAL